MPTPVDLKEAFFGNDTNVNPISSDRYLGDGGLTNFISDVLPTIYILSGFILFIYIAFGGFMIISSAGDSKKAEQGTQALTNAVIGFIIIFASYWIVQIIEIITGVPILK